MARVMHIRPQPLSVGPEQRPRWVPDSPAARLGPSRGSVRVGGFTLIELLTVLTIIAILATLLMTTLSSAKRKAREAVCTSNLHQVAIALHLYLDDEGQRPPDLATLVTTKYLGDGSILSCPADRSRSSPAPGLVNNGVPALHVSYQSSVSWPDDQWNQLMRLGMRAGIVVCTFHDIASAAGTSAPGAVGPAGVILRGQLDGTVLRRHVYPTDLTPTAGVPGRNAAAPVTSFSAGSNGSAVSTVTLPPWDFFSDDPPP